MSRGNCCLQQYWDVQDETDWRIKFGQGQQNKGRGVPRTMKS